MRVNDVMKRGGISVAALLLAMGGIGCAGYGNYSAGEEAGDGGYRLLDSPNSPHMSEVIRRAVVAAVDRAQVSGPYSVRLPAAMDQTRRERVLAELHDPNARLAADGEATDLPVFAVERAIVRVNRAEVDVAIPVTGVAWPDGTAAQQLTTYYLKSGFGRWSVTRMRTWSIGVDDRAIADLEQEAATRDAVVTEDETKSADEPPF